MPQLSRAKLTLDDDQKEDSVLDSKLDKYTVEIIAKEMLTNTSSLLDISLPRFERILTECQVEHSFDDETTYHFFNVTNRDNNIIDINSNQVCYLYEKLKFADKILKTEAERCVNGIAKTQKHTTKINTDML